MAKNKTHYVCSECGDSFLKWMGQCPSCKTWNSLAEFNEKVSDKTSMRSRGKIDNSLSKLSDIPREKKEERILVKHMPEFNRITGGGFVPGSVILLGGEPGVGKSTLLLELSSIDKTIIYVTGEESKEQVASRAARLGVNNPRLSILQENSLEHIINVLEEEKCDIILIDSIQTVFPETGSSGSISMVKEASRHLISLAKSKNATMIITGHVTKDGSIAGPKLLEHSVDVVLYFESYQWGQYRFVKAVKNRYGSTGEIAIYEMISTGLREIPQNQSLVPIEETGGVGSILFPQVEGSRVTPMEIQILVTPSGFSNGRRIGEGVDISRIHLIAAVLEKNFGYHLSEKDIFVRVRGGSHLNDPAGDLAIMIAMISSVLDISVPGGWAAAGEISLTGNIRFPSHSDSRIKSMEQFGVKNLIWGKQSRKEQKDKTARNLPSFLFAHVKEIIKNQRFVFLS